MTHLYKPWYTAVAIWSLAAILFLTASSSTIASPVPSGKSAKPPTTPPEPSVLTLILTGDTKVVKVDRVIVVKEDMTVVNSLPFTVAGPPDALFYFWTYPPAITAIDRGDKLEIASAPKGNLTIALKTVSIDWDNKKTPTRFGNITFAVGDVAPPAPPKPPDPPVPPAPPAPPAPIPDAGLHILMVYDKAKETTLPPAQGDILFGQDVRNYLNSKCAQVAGKADWAIWWPGVDPSSYPSLPLQALWARPRASLPWVVISKDGKSGYEGPLPADLPSTMALFKKYAEGN